MKIPDQGPKMFQAQIAKKNQTLCGAGNCIINNYIHPIIVSIIFIIQHILILNFHYFKWLRICIYLYLHLHINFALIIAFSDI